MDINQFRVFLETYVFANAHIIFNPRPSQEFQFKEAVLSAFESLNTDFIDLGRIETTRTIDQSRIQVYLENMYKMAERIFDARPSEVLTFKSTISQEFQKNIPPLIDLTDTLEDDMAIRVGGQVITLERAKNMPIDKLNRILKDYYRENPENIPPPGYWGRWFRSDICKHIWGYVNPDWEPRSVKIGDRWISPEEATDLYLNNRNQLEKLIHQYKRENPDPQLQNGKYVRMRNGYWTELELQSIWKILDFTKNQINEQLKNSSCRKN